MMVMRVSVQADVSEANVKPRSGGRSQNEHRTRQAIRGLRDMFKKDGLIK